MECGISYLVEYAIQNDWIFEEDKIWACNKILKETGLRGFSGLKNVKEVPSLSEILESIHTLMKEQCLLNTNDQTLINLLDARIICSILTKPSDVIANFNKRYLQSPVKATDWFYNFSLKSNYIQCNQLEQNVKWTENTAYGNFEITINLSKPEKDPAKIANNFNKTSTSYPKCQLCAENEGFLDDISNINKQTLRVIPIKLGCENFFIQYSPYAYYNEHCIIINKEHVPMRMGEAVFSNLLNFVTMFPHYFIGSNAELPLVGASILNHDHYQGGNYTFAIEQAKPNLYFSVPNFKNVSAFVLKWPMAVIKLKSSSMLDLTKTASYILKKWQTYQDPNANIFCKTGSVQHSTITPIARLKNGVYILYLVLRNNITTKEHPLGLFHPHADKHHIKKENIGLIETMGYGILPGRLKKELNIIKTKILKHENLCDPLIVKHKDWVNYITSKYSKITKENIDDILKKEITLTFCNVLKDASVFKETTAGESAFQRFLNTL